MSWKQISLGLLSAAGMLVAAAGHACAQAPTGNQFGARGVARPTTSPYLNLLFNNGQNLGLNYYRSVRPEQEWRRYTTGLNQRLNLVESSLSRDLLPDGSSGDVKKSGHSTTFLNTGSYFPQSR